MFNSMYFNCLIGSIDLISSKYIVLKETAVLRFDNRTSDEVVVGCMSHPETRLIKAVGSRSSGKCNQCKI